MTTWKEGNPPSAGIWNASVNGRAIPAAWDGKSWLTIPPSDVRPLHDVDGYAVYESGCIPDSPRPAPEGWHWHGNDLRTWDGVSPYTGNGDDGVSYSHDLKCVELSRNGYADAPVDVVLAVLRAHGVIGEVRPDNGSARGGGEQ